MEGFLRFVFVYLFIYLFICGPGSSFGIATSYGLDGPGIESRWGEIFRICPERPWGPPSLLYNGYRVFPGGKEWRGRDADPSPPSSAVGHERVELYLYSPYGPYVLYRASVPVQGCTLALFYLFNPLTPELNPICYLLALLGAHHFLHVSRIRVKLLTFRLLMSYIYIYIYIYIYDISRLRVNFPQGTTAFSRPGSPVEASR